MQFSYNVHFEMGNKNGPSHISLNSNHNYKQRLVQAALMLIRHVTESQIADVRKKGQNAATTCTLVVYLALHMTSSDATSLVAGTCHIRQATTAFLQTLQIIHVVATSGCS